MKRRLRDVDDDHELQAASWKDVVNGIIEDQKNCKLDSVDPQMKKLIKDANNKGVESAERLKVDHSSIEYVRQTILKKLLGKKTVKISESIPLIQPHAGLYDPSLNTNFSEHSLKGKYNELYSFLEHGILNGDSSSCLLIGNKSSGKHMVLNDALEKLNLTYNSGSNKAFIKIQLSGLLQTDDKLAVREIARQLDMALNNNALKDIYDVDPENEYEQENTESTDDDEEDEDDDEHMEDVSESENINESSKFERKSISETLSAILSSLEQMNNQDSSRQTVTLVFVLDEFERFATRSRQTLIYNLFDLTTSNHTIPISVIGLTTKVNIVSLLEKRVNSRFSQRIISFFGYINAQNFTKLTHLNYHVNSEVEYFWLDYRYNLCLSFEELKKMTNVKYGLLWNDYINAMFYKTNYATSFKETILKNFITIKNMKELSNAFVSPICKLNEKSPFPMDEHFERYNRVNNFKQFNTKNNILRELLNKSLSDIQLLLLICCGRVIYNLELNYVNFNFCYEEYVKISNIIRNKRNVQNIRMNAITKEITQDEIMITTKIWSKSVCRDNWEFLRKMSLLKAPSSRTTINLKEGTSFQDSMNNNDFKYYQLQISLETLNELVDKGNPLHEYIKI